MATLQELHTAIGDMMLAISDSSGGVSVPECLARIDSLSGELGDGAPPMLRHYLDKRSYAKALDFLQGVDETEKPNC